MSWKAHKITLKLLSPLHVGFQKIGNVQTVRPYVAGRTLWGALVARITRDNSEYKNNYQTVQTLVDERLTLSYFYPALCSDDIQLPWKNPAFFEWQFLASYGSTATSNGHMASEGSLHETEFIASRTRENKQTFLVGYIFEKEENKLPWQDALLRVQLGSERHYGWGKVGVVNIVEEKDKFFDLPLELSGQHPTIELTQADYLPAHALAIGENSIATIDGHLEPLISREWKSGANGGPGKSFSNVQICWMPGAKVQKEASIIITGKGVLQKF